MSETNEKKCDIENETNNDAEDDVVEENSELVEKETSLELTSVSFEIPTAKSDKNNQKQREKRADTVLGVKVLLYCRLYWVSLVYLSF